MFLLEAYALENTKVEIKNAKNVLLILKLKDFMDKVQQLNITNILTQLRI